MKLEQIYLNDINRSINPAVSANDFKEETVRTEINEYVFTEENLQGLYDILSAIRLGNKHHDGIWINGHYGSGKSHFLKFLNYCMNKRFQNEALQRMVEAVNEIDPITTNLNFSSTEMAVLKDWLKRATIDIIQFNIGTVHNINVNQQTVFLDAFLNEFNRFRGFNSYNIALAQYLEKPLASHNKLDEFKQRIADEGFNWGIEANTLAATELDLILPIAKDLVPTLDVEEIKRNIQAGGIFLSVESWTNELRQYLNGKGDDYRLIFLTDEVSQFINNRTNMMLQLQEMVAELHNRCNDQVWIACTAQQDLTEIVSACNIDATSEDYGKIMGRFEVKVSLKSTTPEFITQRRILSKNTQALPELTNLFNQKKIALEQQFDGLPSGYHAYQNAQEFIDYYPFVPYQFALMTKIFDAFVDRKYVATEVRGSERSIIKVTHSIACDTKGQDLGNLISFDQFFGSMFRESLTAVGSRAIESANRAIANYQDIPFAQRVVNILFMLCNMRSTDQAVFSATLPNIVKLLMRDVDANKQELMDRVIDVINSLKTSNIIREEQLDNNLVKYCFYTDDEREVAIAIDSERVDRSFMATKLQELITNYISMPQREKFATSDFTVGASVMGKNFLANNADVLVEFVCDSNIEDPNTYLLSNPSNKLVFFLTPQYMHNDRFRNAFMWYCRAEKYLSGNRPTSEQRSKTQAEFRARIGMSKRDVIETEIRKMFDNCAIISGTGDIITINDKGQQRYKKAIQAHLSNVYSNARLVVSNSIPTDSNALRTAILRPKAPGEYDLNPIQNDSAEQKVQDQISRNLGLGVTVSVKEVVENFSKAPYGWDPNCTEYIINELVRRNIFDYNYNGVGNVDKREVAEHIVRDAARFTIVNAQQISAQLVNDFIRAWGDVFASNTLNMTTDPSELFGKCKDLLTSSINTNNTAITENGQYPFVQMLRDLNTKLNAWNAERDPQAFFQKVINEAAQVKPLIDQRKKLTQFLDNQLTLYKQILQFVDSNRDNWQFLPQSCQSVVEEIKKLPTDPWPVDTLAQYKRYRDALKNELDSVRSAIRSEIERLYKETADTLKQIAAQQNVANYDPRVDNVISVKQQSDNISTLKLHLSTDDYYQQEVAKIMAASKPATPTPHTSAGSQTTTPQPRPSIKSVRLTTRSNSSLKTATDVDNYLNTLRQQMMNHINQGEEIIIL